MNKIEEFKGYLKEIKHLHSALALLYWDQRTYMPPSSSDDRASILGTISSMIFKRQTSEKMKEFYDYFKNSDYSPKNEIEKAMIKHLIRDYEKSSKIPPKLQEKLTILSSKGESAWSEAKEKSDFSILQPILTELVDLKIEVANHIGYDENPYDALIDDFEMGMKASQIEPIFSKLRDATVELLNKLDTSNSKPNKKLLKGKYPVDKQSELNKILLKTIGFDFSYQRLDVSGHPFTISISPNDVRITTHYKEDDFVDAILSTVHEAGHSFYEMNIDNNLADTNLYDGISMGVHESQSRIMENFIGRSYEFWKFFYPHVQETFEQFKKVELDQFYKAINNVERSLIRTQADELTYNLHIILRFELENALINKEIKVKDLPSLWNEKMKKYLSITPPNDAKGVLQDIHWSGGDFGYFPSYALGNLYSAQFYHQAEKDIKNLKSEIENGNIKIFTDWLKNNIHKWGKLYTPSELVEKVTSEPLNPDYFIQYVNNKFSKIYEV